MWVGSPLSDGGRGAYRVGLFASTNIHIAKQMRWTMASYEFQVDEINLEQTVANIKAFNEKLRKLNERFIEQILLEDIYNSVQSYVFALMMV